MIFKKILAKIETMRNKNRFFGRHFETVQHFTIFSPELMVYMVQISLQNSGGKVVFLGGFDTNRSKSTLVTFKC